jgi:Trk K+ transport system NAD-binding subunit
MLDVIIIMAMLGISVFGYRVMKRLDVALEDIVVVDHIDKVRRATVLIYSEEVGHEEAIRTILEELDQQGIAHVETTNGNVQDLMPFTHVVAISDSDLDNLLLCHRAKRIRPNVETIASCSKYVYQSVFKDQGVDWIVTGDRDPVLLNIVTGLGQT